MTRYFLASAPGNFFKLFKGYRATLAAFNTHQRMRTSCSALFRLCFSSLKKADKELSILSLPPQYLRAMDTENYDEVTLQRKDVSFDMNDGKPILSELGSQSLEYAIQDCSLHDNTYRITWEDGMISEYSCDWVAKQLVRWRGRESDRIRWSGLTEEKVRSSSALRIDFGDVLTNEGMKRGLRTLYQYGILLVTNTPIDDNGAGVAALASSLGGGSIKNDTSLLKNFLSGSSQIMLPRGTDGPLRTLYGTVWSTTSSMQVQGASVADSAYGQDGLPLHTDMTYYRDPPGLQIFTMIQPASKGGESVFGDGLAAAELLRSTNPQAFITLSNTIRRYQCVDKETGWHLEAHGPVISVLNGQVICIRHNDLDRVPDLPPPGMKSEEMDAFYVELGKAHEAWDCILAQDDIRLVIGLQPGDTMVVANQVRLWCRCPSLSVLPVCFVFDTYSATRIQRCFHGRYSFEARNDSPRSVMGCYVGQDELSSRFRQEGFDVV